MVDGEEEIRRRKTDLVLKGLRRRIQSLSNGKNGRPAPYALGAFLYRRTHDAMAAIRRGDGDKTRASLEDVAACCVELLSRF